MGSVDLGEQGVGEACWCHVAAGSGGELALLQEQQDLVAAELGGPRTRVACTCSDSAGLLPGSAAVLPGAVGSTPSVWSRSLARRRILYRNEIPEPTGCLTEKQTCRDEVPTTNGDAFIMAQPSPLQA